MELKLGYKQTEVGVIPADWEAQKLGNVADIIMGQSPMGTSYNRNGNGVPLINGPTEFTDKHPVKIQWTTEPTKFSKKGDVLLCVRGSSTGRINISDDNYCIGRGLAAIRARAETDTTFIIYVVLSVVEKILALTTGSTFPNIDGKTIKAIELPYPSKPEQTAIATVLSDTDKLIESLDRLIAKKRDIKQATMQQLLTGKTRLPWFSRELQPDYKRTEVGMIPADWEVKKLGDVADFLDGRRRPISERDRAKMRGEYPYYGASGVVDYVNDYIFDEELILLGEDGENILSRNCRLAFRVCGKIWVNNHAHVLRPKANTDINFLTEYLESLDYEQYNTGTAQPKLNKRICSEIIVFLPPLPEQQAIATILSDMDAEIAALEQKRDKTRALKRGMMQELLTGKTRLV